MIAQIKIKYYTNSVRYSSVDYVFYTSRDGYEKLGGDMDSVMSYLFQCEDEKEGQMEQFLASYTENQEPMMSFESKTRYLDDFQSLKRTFTLVGGVLSLIIGIIGVLNFVNACITSIITRKKEFAALKAIGMTEKTDPQDGLPGRKLLRGRSGFIQSDGGKSLFSGGDGEFRDILVYNVPVYPLAYAYRTSLYGSDGISSPLSDYQGY